MSPRAAAIQAGLVRPSAPKFGGACDFEAAAALTPKAQGKLLCQLFGAVGLDAQCDLIARQLEPRLGAGLAHKWRSASP
jgi:hypothetical protein